MDNRIRTPEEVNETIARLRAELQEMKKQRDYAREVARQLGNRLELKYVPWPAPEKEE